MNFPNCRHLNDADFCGRGPDLITEKDFLALEDKSHQYFFARKFSTQEGDPFRQRILDSANEYYQGIKPYISNKQLKDLITWYEGGSADITHFSIIPQLQAVDPCCQYAFDRRFQSVQDYAYILDFDTSKRAKFSFLPRCQCYGFGHLRGIRATAFPKSDNYSLGLPLNMPFNFFPLAHQGHT